MADDFDPYYTWLGIRPEEQPPDHYRLIGLRQFEGNADVIANASDRQMQFLRSMQVGKRSAQSQQLLNEISAAGGCLLDPQRKAAYDKELKAKEAAKAQVAKAAAAKAKPLPKAAALEPIPKPLPLTAKLPEPDLFSIPMPQNAYVAPVQTASPSTVQSASKLPLILAGSAGGIMVLLAVVIVVGSMLSGGKTVVDKSNSDPKGSAGSAGTTPSSASSGQANTGSVNSNIPSTPTPSPGESTTKTPGVTSQSPPTGTNPIATAPAESDWKPPTEDSQAAFRSVLGTYMYGNDRAKAYPYVNLQVPRKNLWSPGVEEKVRGKVPYDEISYVGTAKIAVPADGTYVWDAEKSGRLQIDGKVVAEWDTPKGEIKITEGVHELIFEIGSHGGNWMRETNLGLKHKETGEEVPFFNTWRDIQKFLATPINGQSVTEVSGWQPTQENELKNYSQLLASAEAKGPTWQPPAPGDPVAFRSFLGSYMYWLDRKKTYPVVNLQVPNKNLWTDDVQIRGKGKASPDEISYIGTAKFAIPATGIYVLDTERVSRIRIDGQIAAEWDAPKGEITVSRGLHDLTVEVGSHGQPYVREFHFRLTRKETGEEIPMFNTWQDIQRFLNTPVNGERVIEASGWQPEEKYAVKNYGELLASAGVSRPGIAVSHPAGPALPAPIHSWSFDEKAGYSVADSGKGDAQGKSLLRLTGWRGDEPTFVPGRIGNALRFSQPPHYAATDRYTDYPQLSVVFWLRVLEEQGINPRIATPWVDLNLEHRAGVGVLGTIVEPQKPEVGKWYHYAVTVNQQTKHATLYRDGVEVASGKLGDYESRRGVKFWAFGHNQDQNNASDTLRGELDELKIYDRVLTPSEVRNLAATELAKATGKEPGTDPAAVAAAAVEKLAVPDATALDKARKELVEIFGAEAKAATTSEKKSELAKRMMQVAVDSNEEPAVQYALFDNARKLLMTAGEAEQALAAVDSLAALFQLDPWSLKIETATGLSDASVTPSVRDQIAARLLAASDEAMSTQKFAAAEDFARLAAKVSAKGKDVELRKSITQKRTDLTRLKQHFAKVEGARAQLLQNSEDAEANQTVGRFVALGIGDFDSGVPYLAKGGQSLFVAAATADVRAAVLEPGAPLAAADAWYKLAESLKADDKSASTMAMRRAKDWYEAAARESLGLEKIRVERRIKELQDLATTFTSGKVASIPAAAPVVKGDPRPSRPTGRGKAIQGMVGRGFGEDKDAGFFYIYHPGYKFTREEMRDFMNMLGRSNVRVEFLGTLTLSADAEVVFHHVGGSSNRGVHYLHLDGKEIHAVGDDRTKDDTFQLKLGRGDHLLRWVLTGGEMGDAQLEVKLANPEKSRLVIQAAADMVSAAKAPGVKREFEFGTAPAETASPPKAVPKGTEKVGRASGKRSDGRLQGKFDAVMVIPGGVSGGGKDLLDGWEFKLKEDLTVTELGIYDDRQNGLGSAHEVAIWDLENKTEPVVKVTVPAGEEAALAGVFRCVSVAKTELKAGRRYAIVAHYGDSGDPSVSMGNPQGLTVEYAPIIEVLGRRYGFPHKAMAFPSSLGEGAANANIGPTFRFNMAAKK